MNIPEIWKTNSNYETKIIEHINANSFQTTKLLDLNKESYSLFEKFVYDTALHHFKRLNIDITKPDNEYYVEFWSKNKFETNKLHLDCDEYEKKTNFNYIYPIMSCLTYFNENPSPTIITNIDLDSYKYKEFENQTTIVLSMPKTNKQITFDGKYYHGSTCIMPIKNDDRYIIAINLWNKKPKNVEYFTNKNEESKQMYKKEEQIFTIEKQEDKITTINVTKSVINYDFFQDILYNNKTDLCYRFNKLIENVSEDVSENVNEPNTTFKIVLDTTIEKKELDSKLKNKYGDVMDDINEIMNETIKLKYNRFLQRFCYNKIYTPDMCKFIINECEKYAVNNGGWTLKRHDNYPTTDLPVEKIQSIFGLVLETMNAVSSKVKKSYCLNENFKINIKDLFVVKYKDNAQNHLELHCDGSFLSFNILLSDKNDFEGGGTYFDDGLTAHLEQGDILIHSSRIKHAGLPVTKGTRYLLVGFLNINIPIENN
jgi:hypothetical protein